MLWLLRLCSLIEQLNNSIKAEIGLDGTVAFAPEARPIFCPWLQPDGDRYAARIRGFAQLARLYCMGR